MRRAYSSEAIERKWLDRWSKAQLYDAVPGQPGDKKFVLHFAYPGISGYLHVGHMRGFTYSDVFCRYRRMTGHRVLFPAGFHASGIPSVGLARRVERQDAATLEYLRNNGCPAEQIPKLKDPLEVVRYFSQIYENEYWRRFGFLIDWRTLCTTVDPGYQRFIQWQFRQLQAHQLLIQKPHYAPFCPVDGAVAVDASETDISKGGQAEQVEFTLVKFRHEDGTIMPCATLRPETVYGVTNLWLNPETTYVVASIGKEKWFLSEPAHEKLKGQRAEAGKVLQTLSAKQLSAWANETVRHPLTGASLPILFAPFVSPRRGTGVVMSVPAHAPYDWQALHEAHPEIQPLVIVKSPKARGVPAEDACRRHGVKSQLDTAALDKATEEVYADEFHAGEMLPNCGPLAGLKCSQAKEKVKGVLAEREAIASLQDFNEDVVCRCGRDVYIRQIPDQWFINYSNPDLTERSKDHARTMRIFPEEYQRDLPSVLDWFGDRACIRTGSWLGTEFPFKAGWIIEPISDSTLYPAYYLVSPYVRDGTLKAGDLTDAFFDFVYLGKGKAAKPAWNDVRRDFEFWYPVDINLGGKEHKTVHFPPYVMNHVALLPPERCPRGIFVNWWVTQEAGGKISKSKGGAEPIPDAAKKYSVDGMRLYYCNVASPHVDIEWDPEVVLRYRAHVERLYRFVLDWALEPSAASAPGIDAWLEAAWRRRWNAARQAFEAYDLRVATQQAYFEFYNDLLWFRRRGGGRGPAVDRVLRDWVASLAPVTPFLAEELWEALAQKGLASTAQLPPELPAAAADVLAQEDFLRQVLEDVGAIARVTQRVPRRVLVYTAPAWKHAVSAVVRAAVQKGERNPGNLIKEIVGRPEYKPHAKEVAAFVQRAYKEALEQAGGDGRSPQFDEFQFLKSAAPFLTQALNVEDFQVYHADDAGAPDPGNKRGAAAPFKPALYLE